MARNNTSGLQLENDFSLVGRAVIPAYRSQRLIGILL